MKHISRILFLFLITFGSSIIWSCSTATSVEKQTYTHWIGEEADEEVIIAIDHHKQTIDAEHKLVSPFKAYTLCTSISKNVESQSYTEAKKRQINSLSPKDILPLDPEYIDNNTVETLKKFIEYYEEQLKGKDIKGDPQ